MTILSAQEIKAWDEYTIQEEPISSIDLMERAATSCTKWIAEKYSIHKKISIYCGQGNNGGDGLAIARQLSINQYQVKVFILKTKEKGSIDFETNLERLQEVKNTSIHFIYDSKQFSSVSPDELIVDAIFGTGLSKPLEGLAAQLANFLNSSGNEIIAIDIPSGLFTDKTSIGNVVIRAHVTLSFQVFKLAFFMAENSHAIGKVHLLSIGLHPSFLKKITAQFQTIDDEIVAQCYKRRDRFAHKGDFGHALLLVGSYGKIGAAVLSAKACLRSGVGLLSCFIPSCGYSILQSTVPEAMVLASPQIDFLCKTKIEFSTFQSVGIGPGIGTDSATVELLEYVLKKVKSPLVLDADALNIIAGNKKLLKQLPVGAILTPHPKEFERLFGKMNNDFDRMELALQKAIQFKCYILLKGHHSFIACPDGTGYFNNTGNAGMATGGSGDVLTGLITGLLAQGYSPLQAVLLGVYIHGSAGDAAADEKSEEGMIASDIVENFGKVFKRLAGNKK